MFDRTKPVLQVGLGKWFTPSVGGRVGFQGLQFKNANLANMNYQYYHADFMYNLTHNLQQDEFGISKFDVIPFVGVGIVRNGSTIPGSLTSEGKNIGIILLTWGMVWKFVIIYMTDCILLVKSVA